LSIFTEKKTPHTTLQTTNQKTTKWHTEGEEGFVGASGVVQPTEDVQSQDFVLPDER